MTNQRVDDERGPDARRTLLRNDLPIKIALRAVADCSRKGACRLRAQRAGNAPAGPAPVLAAVHAVYARFQRRGACAEGPCIAATRLTATAVELPAVDLFRPRARFVCSHGRAVG